MALQKPFMIKVQEGNTDLSLEASAGEAFLIKDVMIYNPANNYVSLITEKNTVGYFRVGGPLGSHLPFSFGRIGLPPDWTTTGTAVGDVTSFAELANAGGAGVAAGNNMIGSLSASTTYQRVGDLVKQPIGHGTLLEFLIKQGWMKGYPVAEGEKFSISGAAQAGAIQLVVFEVYDPEDIDPTQPNGQKSNENLIIQYGDSGGAINTAGETLLTESNTPAEFPAFPFGETLGVKRAGEIYGILGSEVCPAANNGTDYTYTTRLRVAKNRQTLWDQDGEGLFFNAFRDTAQGDMDNIGEGFSMIGGYSDIDVRPPFILPQPLSVAEGDELNIFYVTAQGGAGQNISEALQEVAVIEKITRQAGE